MEALFLLFVIYQLKHFIADYPLQTTYMLGKFKGGWGWVLPLSAHAAVHGIFTTLIAGLINPSLWWLGLVDFFAHGLMDLIKANPKLLGRYKALSGAEYMACANMVETGQKSDNVELRMAAILGKQKIRSNKYFWWCLGLDQMVHHLTHYYIIWKLVAPFSILLNRTDFLNFLQICEELHQKCGG